MESFVPLAERIVEAVLESRPGLATSVGDHRYDDRLPDLSAGGVAAARAMLREAADALSDIDPDALDLADQVDHALLSSLVDRGLFESTEMRAHEWDPLRHNPGPLLHALLARPFAPAEVRLTSLAGRLAAVPDALATARATLRDMPRIHAETAVGQFTGTAALIRDELPALLAQAPSNSTGSSRRRPRRSPRWRSSSPGCGSAWPPTPAPAVTRAWAAAAGRPASGTPWTPSWAPPRSSVAPRPTWTGSPPRSARPPSSWSAAEPTTRRYARRWTCSPPSTRTTGPSSSWPG